MNKSKYLLPNLFTSANLACGFLSMIAAHKGQFTHAALAILVAAALDCIDGKVARLTNSASAFGVEYDSLADLLSFGIAPGWLLYTWALQSLSPIGWLGSLVFILCGALRLARFNVQAASVQKYVFTGLPIPAAASVVATAVLLSEHLYSDLPPGMDEHPLGLVLAVYGLAFLMVSNFKYRSFKRFRIKRGWSLPLLLSGVMTLGLIAMVPEISWYVLFLLFLSYALSGPIETLVRRKKPKENVIPAEQ